MKKVTKEISKELLEDLYIKQRKSYRELKSIFNIGLKRLKSLLNQYGLTRKEKPKHKLTISEQELTPELFKKLYIDQNMSIKEIKNKLGVSSRRFYKILKSNNLNKPWDLIVRKREKTCMDRYGVNSPLQSKAIQDKLKKTCVDRYGVENISQTPQYRNKMKIQFENGSITKKKIATMHKNNSFGKSKPEGLIFEKLIEKFPKTLKQYDKDLRYPYSCDFYVPELDLFIEYNGYWNHGKKPYNKEDNYSINLLKKWYKKSHTSDTYNYAIWVFTKRDPEKREIAKKNNLNFKELWNIKEAIEFINSL